jgi:Domain of unknown function (DUF6484)
MHDVVERVPPGIHGFSIRRFLGFDAAGMPLVTAGADDTSGTPTLSLVSLKGRQQGAEVAVVWLDDKAAPLILGLIQPPAFVAEADGERVVIEGSREVVLRCGKASITLGPDGSITIRGGQILSRADGANRVQGASVQLN